MNNSDSHFESAADYLLSSVKEPPILIFLDGQYIFRWKEGDRVKTKLISAASLRSAFATEPIDSGWISPNIFRCGISAKGDWSVLFYPPRKVSILLHLPKTGIEELNVPMPGLVFFGIHDKYYIWAIKENTFSPESIIYHAPLPNVSSSEGGYDRDIAGRICFGENFLPNADPIGIEKAWTMFFKTAFTDHFVDGKSTKHKADIRTALIELGGKHKYPLKTLIPVYGNLTIDRVINRLTRNL